MMLPLASPTPPDRVDCHPTAVLGAAAAQGDGLLIWIDLELTGLDPTDEIIEVFCLITDGQLRLLDEQGWGTVVYQPRERMDRMGEWCTRVHGANGLTEAVVHSTVTAEQAAAGLLAYITRYAPEKGIGLLAGSSVHGDKSAMERNPFFRKVVDHLHYRILDVSTVKEIAKRWCPDIAAKEPQKKITHRAKDDILESVELARYYKHAIFEADTRVSSA